MSDPTTPATTGQEVTYTATPAEQRKQAELEERSAAMSFLDRLRGGAFMLKAARALREVTKAVHEQQAKGTVTITLSITPVKKSPGAVSITDKIVAKPPMAEPPSAVMFTTADGALSYEHPDQLAAFPADRTGGAR